MGTTEYTFDKGEIIELKCYRDKQDDPRLKVRFIALLMIAQNIASVIVASVIGKSIKSVERWLAMYQTQGIDSLNNFHYSPKKQYLSDDEVSQMVDWVKNTNPKTVKEVSQYIQDNFKIWYSHEAVRKMLKKNGLKFLRPKVVPGNPPSEEEQQKQIDKYFEMKSSFEPGTIFLFGDAMHLIHQNIPGLCWGDPKNPLVIQTNTGRQRLNILGAYDPDSCSFIHLTGEENCNANRVVEFFEVILASCKDAPKIVLFSDNAKYQKARIVSDWLEENKKLQVEFLPPYSPNLNLGSEPHVRMA